MREGGKMKRQAKKRMVLAAFVVAEFALATALALACEIGQEGDGEQYCQVCKGGGKCQTGVAPQVIAPRSGCTADVVEGPVHVDGYMTHQIALPQLPDGSGHLPQLGLSYESGNLSWNGGYGIGWELDGYARASKISSTEVRTTLGAETVMRFYKDGQGNWNYKVDGPSGTAQDVDQVLTVPADTGQKIELKDRRTGEQHLFYNFDGQAHAGMPYRYEDRSGNTVDYVIGGGNGKCVTAIVDSEGREIDFSYNGDYRITTIEYGLKLKVEFTYDGNIDLRKINVRRDTNGDGTWTDQVHYFWYGTGNLLKYYVAPEQYGDLPGSPTEAQVSSAASRQWTYDGNRVVTQTVSSCGGCGGGGGSTEGVVYVAGTVSQSPPDSNTSYKKTEHYYPGDAENDPSVTSEVNFFGQLLKEKRKVDQSKTHLQTRSYTSDGKLEYIYHYDNSDLQNPLQVTKYTYDGSNRVTKVEVSQSGSSWITTTEYTYGDGNFPRLPTVVKEYENDDGTCTLQTDYEYYDSGNGLGKVKKITYPQVNHNLDEAGGSAYRATREYTYDSLSRAVTETDEDGMVTKYIYADADSVDNDGDSTTDETDEWGAQLVKVIQDYGGLNLTVAQYEYSNTTNRMTKSKDPLGNETTYAYADNGYLASVTYPGGLYVAYVYDKNGNKTQEEKKTSSGGTTLAKTKWVYDKWGNVTEEQRFFGTGANDYGKTVYTYDSLGRNTRVKAYKDKNHNFAAVEDTTYVTVTSLPKQLKRGSTDGTTDTLVTTTSFKYDVMSRRTEEKDEVKSATTTYAYDWRGRNTSVTGPEKYYVSMTYDNLGRVTEQKRRDTNEQGTLFEDTKTYYDEVSRVYLSQIINPGDTETADTNNYFSKGGKLKKLTDPYSKSTTYAYDGAGRQTKVTDALGNEVVAAYYDDGKVKYTQQRNKIADQTYVTYSRGSWYDSDRHLAAAADYGTGSLPDPWPSNAPSSSDSVHVTSYTYDKLGRTTQVTDAAGMQVTSAYDMLSRRTEEIQDAAQGGLGIKVTWVCDTWDGTNSIYYDTIQAWKDAQNHEDTVYSYGAAKHPYAVTKTTYPDSGYVTVTYNDDGTVATRVDQRSWTVTYSYDNVRRVTQESVSGNGLVGTSTVTYAYDALGRPTSATDNNDPNDANDNSTVEWAYTRQDNGDLKVEETQKYGQSTDRKVTTTYDLAGRLKTLAYPSGLTLTYSYDDIGRVTAVNDGTNDRVADTYKGWLLQKRTYASGAYLTHLDDNNQNLSTYGYDAFGRVKNHRWKSSGGTLLAGWSHDYDRLGNKKYQEDLQAATRSELYGYDAVYRVTSFKRGQLNQDKTDITSPNRTQTWTLDKLGNWSDTTIDSTTETRTHNDVNELTQRTIGGNNTDLTYDDAGNLIQDGTADGSHQYVWDYRNRLIEAKEKQSGNWNTVGVYKYDAQGRRIRKVVTNKGGLNGTTRFIWGGDSDWQCLEERDSDDALGARFTYSSDYIDAVAVQERDLNADSDFGDTNEVVYYHSNTLSSVYALSDSSGSVIERYKYDAYGACAVLDADGSVDSDGLSDVGNPYLFTGGRLDTETGLMHYRNRCYAPALGRFASRDPVGYRQVYDLYAYASDLPTQTRDPMGLQESIAVPGQELPPLEDNKSDKWNWAGCRIIADCPEDVRTRVQNSVNYVCRALKAFIRDVLDPAKAKDIAGAWKGTHEYCSPLLANKATIADVLEIIIGGMAQTCWKGAILRCVDAEDHQCKIPGTYAYKHPYLWGTSREVREAPGNVLWSPPGEIRLCPLFFTKGAESNTITILHEIMHFGGARDKPDKPSEDAEHIAQCILRAYIWEHEHYSTPIFAAQN